jgi:ribonuclease VapC
MIAIDTSAIVAIFFGEKNFEELLSVITNAEHRIISSVSYLEAALVLTGRVEAPATDYLDSFFSRLRIEIIPFDHEQSRLASQAFIRFGKGRHSAGLNFGDCAAYALASKHNLPLLFKGGDFAKTDIRPAINPNP